MGWQLTASAADDLAQIYRHGVARFGATQADVYHSALEDLFGFLSEYPRAARERDEIRPPVRAYPYKAHLILYAIESNDAILILRIRQCGGLAIESVLIPPLRAEKNRVVPGAPNHSLT